MSQKRFIINNKPCVIFIHNNPLTCKYLQKRKLEPCLKFCYYTGSDSKVGFDKETPRKDSPERMTIAERQGMSEEDHFEAKSMLRKLTFESRAVYHSR